MTERAFEYAQLPLQLPCFVLTEAAAQFAGGLFDGIISDYNSGTNDSIEMHLLKSDELQDYLANTERGAYLSRLCASQQFKAAAGQVLCVADDQGQLIQVLIGYNKIDMDLFKCVWGSLAAGNYALSASCGLDWSLISLAWAQASYDYQAQLPVLDQRPAQTAAGDHQSSTDAQAVADASVKRLCVPAAAEASTISSCVAEYLVRNLINAPTNLMSPARLAAVVEALAKQYSAEFKQVVGDELLEQNFPAIHAVGRASAFAPRLLELNWGDDSHPELVLIGKGVCFDSGGLDIKPTVGMRFMKKDMGGAAHVIALAYMVMQAQLPVRLRLLIPAVENAVGAAAYRPGDVIRMRNGLQVEVTNTDAEGRLVLADALALANESNPDLVIDMATLTGAARVAVGPDIISYFSALDSTAAAFEQHAVSYEALHRLPLHQPYMRFLDSRVADFANAASKGHAGALTAALFLQRFMQSDCDWLHFDIFAWQDSGSQSGMAAVQGIYSLHAMLSQRYTST